LTLTRLFEADIPNRVTSDALFRASAHVAFTKSIKGCLDGAGEEISRDVRHPTCVPEDSTQASEAIVSWERSAIFEAVHAIERIRCGGITLPLSLNAIVFQGAHHV
jgi:hypothetical protein